MTFRNRLILTFTVLVAAIISLLSVVVFYFSTRYTRRDFFERLRDRALTAAQVYLEEDEMSENTYKAVLRKYQRNLTDEEVFVYTEDHEPAFVSDLLEEQLQERIFRTLDRNDHVEFTNGDKQWAGILYHDNQGQFYVLVSAVDATGGRKLDNLRTILLLSFFGSIGVVWFTGRFLADRVLQPIADIVRRVNDIRASSLHLRLQEHNSKDEIAQLSKTFNQMLDRLETSFEMQRNFISNASHELRNPLTAISGEIEVTLLKERSAEEYIQSLETLQNETNRLERLTSDLLRLAQAGFDEKDVRQSSVRLDELLLECLSEVQVTNAANRFHLQLGEMPQQAESLSIAGNSNLLKMAITNVLENALKFSGNQEVLVHLYTEEQQVIISIEDKGIGIPATDTEKIFQPFYRSANARGHAGTGIGLSLTHRILLLHGASIQVHSAEGAGTQVRLVFLV